MQTSSVVALVVRAIPRVLPLLKSGALRLCLKTQDFFEGTVDRLIRDLYYGYIDGANFSEIMFHLLQGQIGDAYQTAWEEDGNTTELPDYLVSARDEAVMYQFGFVDAFKDEIIAAAVDEAPVDQFISRAALWANNWDSEYNRAKQLIASENGGKLVWVEGDTADKCETCLALDGIVAYASEWEEAGVRPQNAPNDRLLCGGWRCGCSLQPTSDRKTPNALERIMGVIA